MDWTKPYEEARKITLKLNEEGIAGNRSSQRTDALNNETIKIIKQFIPKHAVSNWRFETEKKIKCSRGDTFSIDVLCYKNNVLKCLVLLKAVESSYNKNRHNYANTSEGECARIFDYEKREDDLSVIFIDWIPNKLPTGDKFEKPKVADISKSEERWNAALIKKQSSVSFCKIRFDMGTYQNVSGGEKLKKELTRRFS